MSKAVAKLQFNRRQSGQSRHPRRRDGWGAVRVPPPRHFFLLFDLKMEHIGAVFKLDLTEENKDAVDSLLPHTGYA